MKQTSRHEAIEAAMRPGALTGGGMLGSDRRTLAEILDADHAAVQRLGVTHEAIAGRMRELRNAGARGLGQTVRVLDRFEVRVDGARGALPCPFQHDGMYAKEFVEARNLASGEQVVFAELNIHMIEAHGFYEGIGAPFRQDPAVLTRVLEVERQTGHP